MILPFIANDHKQLTFEMAIKFIYSEKATKFCEVFPLLLVHTVKIKGKISQNFGAFSEYMNFKEHVLKGLKKASCHV